MRLHCESTVIEGSKITCHSRRRHVQIPITISKEFLETAPHHTAILKLNKTVTTSNSSPSNSSSNSSSNSTSSETCNL
jgi:hypothetical protein